MSREAKIGLLVALAFLLVIGLLLSDHVTSVNREPPAPLTASARVVQAGLAAPGVQTGNVVIPEPAYNDAGQPYVLDRGSDEPPTLEVNIGAPAEDETPADAQANAGDWLNPTPGPAQPTQMTNDPFGDLAEEARAAGEPVQFVKPADASQSVGTAIADYEVVAGDTLGAIASKVFGSNTSDTQQRILALNPALAANPDRLAIGQVLKVPAKGSSGGSNGGGAVASSTSSRTQTTPAAPATGGNARVYEVKSGDTLSEISQRTLGTSKRWREILKLNGDKLGDAGDLQVGMKLKLPA